MVTFLQETHCTAGTWLRDEGVSGSRGEWRPLCRASLSVSRGEMATWRRLGEEAGDPKSILRRLQEFHKRAPGPWLRARFLQCNMPLEYHYAPCWMRFAT